MNLPFEPQKAFDDELNNAYIENCYATLQRDMQWMRQEIRESRTGCIAVDILLYKWAAELPINIMLKQTGRLDSLSRSVTDWLDEKELAVLVDSALMLTVNAAKEVEGGPYILDVVLEWNTELDALVLDICFPVDTGWRDFGHEGSEEGSAPVSLIRCITKKHGGNFELCKPQVRRGFYINTSRLQIVIQRA